MKLFSFFFVFLFLLSNAAFVSANDCDDFCLEKEYAYGVCRETSETSGFCEGEDEDVYGFSACVDYERCCCGNEQDDSSSGDNSSTAEDSSAQNASPRSFSEQIFFPLAVVVILLALAVILKKKMFREEKKEDIIEK